MAWTNSISYCGKYSFDFFAPALFQNEIMSRFSPFDGVKNQITLPNVVLAGHVVPDACAFNPEGNITLEPRILTACAYKVNEIICREDVEASFLSERLRLGANAPIGPEEFNAFLLGQLQRQIGNDMQNVLWNGNTEGGDIDPYLLQCDGLLAQFGATSPASGVLGLTGGGLTAGNVISTFSTIYSTVPDAVKNSGYPIVMFAAQNVVDAYKIAQINTNGGLLPTGDKALNFLGIEVVPTPFLPASNVVVCDPRNIAIGFDLLSDMQEVRIIDTSETIGESAIRLAARWRFGVTYRIGPEIVWYRP